MTSYTLNKYDFVKYLLDTRKDAKLDDTIFWLSTFPLPASIVHDVFERRGPLIKTYLDHLYAVMIYAKELKDTGTDWDAEIREQPNAENRIKEDYFLNIFRNGLSDTSTRRSIETIASSLMIYGYKPTENDLFDAICHSGRKYSRLYIPKQVKDIIRLSNPELLKVIATGNRDMFGQPVADEFRIYRMGFSDKLVAIFNDLMHFILSHSNEAGNGLANASDIHVTQSETDHAKRHPITYGSVSDGSLWEPTYKQATVLPVFNQKHPFCDLMKTGGQGDELVGDLVSALAECEYAALGDREKKFYELMRENVSRKLRISSITVLGV